MGITFKNCFEYLSSGNIASVNSKYEGREISHFLSDADNFTDFNEILSKIGFKLYGESGYWYMSRSENLKDIELKRFIDRHKEMFLTLSIVKELFPSLIQSQTIKKTDFTVKYKADKKVEIKLNKIALKIFKKDNVENIKDDVFNVLKKGGVLEQRDMQNKDEYTVLNGIKYYMNILEKI